MTNKDNHESSFIHSIHIEGKDKTCATAKTIWRKIDKDT